MVIRMGDSGRFQCHAGSGRARATEDREGRLILWSTVTVPDSSLSTLILATHTELSTLTIHRRLIEQTLRSYQPLRHLSFTPARCQARLWWSLAPSG
ncbi:HTH_Tnp_Tc3_2 domain-containing protein [Trichonephila clavipes]|nr:HTH_Tnp_Tc3_2 domain-containing protein [Trichonephila clavipes]